MNNKAKIAAQELIIAYAQAEIEGLKSQKSERFKPEYGGGYFIVDNDGEISTCRNHSPKADTPSFINFNCFETEELATKAAAMMKRSNAIIMACLMADPDFVPDYLSGNQAHYSFGYTPGDIGYISGWGNGMSYTHNCGPCVSTLDKWEEAAALLTEWEIT
jgi:hypothetical protein